MIKPLLSFFCLFLFLFGQNSSAQTSLSVSSHDAYPNEEFVVSVSIENDEAFNAFQFDLCFPSELTWKQGSSKLSSRAGGHELTVSLVEPGRLRIVSYSMTLNEFSGSTGNVFQTSFIAGGEPGNWFLSPENVTIGGLSGNIIDQINKGTITLLSPKLSVNTNLLNFDEVPLGENETRNLALQNTGNQELNVTGFAFGDSRFSSSNSQAFTIPAGQTHNLEIVFKSETKGLIESSIRIQSDQPSGDFVTNLQALAFAVNEIHLLAASGHSGQEVEVAVSLNNMEAFSGFQFTIPLPDVATFVEGSAKLNSDRISDHLISTSITNQQLTIIAYSPSNTDFIGNEGQIMTIKLYLEGQGRYYPLIPENAIIANSEGGNIISASSGANIRLKAPRISVGTNLVDYAKVSTLETQSRDLVIRNYGDAELRIDELMFGDSHFSTSRELPILIPASGNETISIQFSAEDGLLHESFLRIRSNDVERDPTTIQLRAQSYFANELQVVNAWFQTSSRDTLYVNLFNQQEVSGFQFDIAFPPGLIPASSEVFLTDRKEDHSLVASELSSGKIRLLCWSASLRVFSGTDGLVVGIPVDIASDVTGTHNVLLSNVVISNDKGKSIESDFSNGTLTIGMNLSKVDYHIADGLLLNTTAAMEYAMGDDNWKTCSDGTTPNVLFKEGNLKIREIAASSNTRLIASLSMPSGPAIQIDFKNESSMELIPENVCYSTFADLSKNLNWGLNQIVGFTPGQDLYFRTKASAHKLSSHIVKLSVPLRPASPVHTIDYVGEQTFEVIGANEAYSSDAFVNDRNEGNGDRLDLSPGNSVWFSYLATASSFRSDMMKMEVKARPAKPVFTVNYAKMETLELILDNVEFATDAEYSINYGVGTNKSIALVGGTNYWFRVRGSNENEQFRSESSQLLVAPIPTAPQYAIDYLNEKTIQEVSETIEYSENASFTQNVKRGIGAIIAVVPGTDLWFRVAQTKNNPQGEMSHLVIPKRPIAPVHSIDYENENTFETVATNEVYSSDAFVNDSHAGTGDRLDLIPGTDIWFSYPARENSFCSDKVKLEVKARPAKPIFTVNYELMKTYEIVPKTIEYASNAIFTKDYGVGSEVVIPLTTDFSYWFREMASNTFEQFHGESYKLDVTSTPAAPEYSIDYLNEQTAQEIPENVEYAENAAFTQNVQRGTNEKLDLEPGKDMWFRIASTDNNPVGIIYHLDVPTRPISPSHTIDYINEQTFELVAANEAYSSDGFVNDVKDGTGDQLTISPGNAIWFTYPATASSFRSDIMKMEVKDRPNKPHFTIDYAKMETSDNVGETIEYANDKAYTYGYGLGMGQALSLKDGISYWFRVKASNTSEEFHSESFRLDVSPIPAAPRFTIDYLNEQTAEEIPKSVEYSENASFTQNVQRGLGAMISVSPGVDLWFRVAQTENSPSGSISHLVVPQRPDVPVHSIDYESEQTFEIVAAKEAYSTDAFVSNINEGRGDYLKLNPGDALWFFYPSTVNSFCSEKVKLEVKARPEKPVFTINYAQMKTSEIVLETIEYANDAVYTQNYGIGNGQALSLIANHSYWFRVKASNMSEQFHSESFYLDVAPIPSAPEYKIDYLNEQTAEKIPESVEYAEDPSFIQNVQRGSGERITVTPGKDLLFRIVQSNSHSAGEKYHLTVPERPLAPVLAEENDATDIFDWNWVNDFTLPEDYEFSMDGGETWELVSEKPLRVGDLSLPAGMLQVRLASHTDGDVLCFKGLPLVSSIDFSILTGIEEVDVNISVYPNPVSNYVRIKLPAYENGRLVLTNPRGQVLLIKDLKEENLTLNISHLSSGAYFLLMEIDGTRSTRKLIKL